MRNTVKENGPIGAFNKDGTPLLIVEYKAPDVRYKYVILDRCGYNMVLKAQYLIVSNGLSHYCCVIDYQAN